jgi:ArsR family transcriptional regulator
MNQLAMVFKALADPSRLRILNILFHSGELCVCDIERTMGFTQTKVSRHLGYLKRAGLVDDRRQGLWMLYRIAEPENNDQREILGFIRQLLLTHPNAALDAAELKRSITQGCCTTFNVIKPDQIPVELKLN